MKLDSLDKLFDEELADLYDAENQLTKALPKMIKAVHAPELRAALESHLAETRTQLERLDQISSELGRKPAPKSCKAMKGLIAEADEHIGEDGDPSVRDAALIGAAQRVEHYEMAAYGCARTYAELLGLGAAARLLQESLNEEHNADEKLNEIAKTIVNLEAARA